MSVSSLRRFAVLLGVAVVSFLIYACERPTQPPPVKPKEPDVKLSPRETQIALDVFCERGNQSRSRPLICIDERSLTAHPHPAVIHDFEASPEGKRTSRPVVVHWFSKRSANLRLEYKSPGCEALTPLECDGRGHCKSTVRVTLGDKEQRKCTYGITVGEMKDPDGDIIIQPCCWLDIPDTLTTIQPHR